LLGLAGLASLASGCDDGNTCGAGTTLVDGVCTATPVDFAGTTTTTTCGTDTVLMGNECVSTKMLSLACGTNQTFDTGTMKCKLEPTACESGTMLNPMGTGCGKATVQGSLIFAATTDRVWSNLRYVNGNSLLTLGDLTTVTAAVPDSTPIYLGGPIGGPIGAGQSFNPTTLPYYQFGKRPDLPVYWGENRGNPSTTPVAIDHQITVGEWRKCTVTWGMYINPPTNTTTKHLYRMAVDATGCPPELLFELWWLYFNGKYVNTRGLGTPPGGLPNVFVTQLDGTGHWERDFDPQYWTKSGIALNGNTHGIGVGKGFVPDLAVNSTASFGLSVFIHNDTQSNGNAGWCVSDPNDATRCGTTNVVSTINIGVSGTDANTPNHPAYTQQDDLLLPTPYVRPYLFMPGKVGFESVFAFNSGSVVNVSTNTMPLSMLQPY
jgi:hypothetical protein